jgi:hypothetical protein
MADQIIFFSQRTTPACRLESYFFFLLSPKLPSPAEQVQGAKGDSAAQHPPRVGTGGKRRRAEAMVGPAEEDAGSDSWARQAAAVLFGGERSDQQKPHSPAAYKSGSSMPRLTFRPPECTSSPIGRRKASLDDSLAPSGNSSIHDDRCASF